MHPLGLRELHLALNGRFVQLDGTEVVADYGDPAAEYTALRDTAGVLDLSFRSRLCLLGEDRIRFLHGQVTNDIKRLRTWEGCYAALVTAKGKMQSDLNVHILENEVLLDFEPGLASRVSQRLEGFIVADDVQVVDVAPLYGLLHVHGPAAPAVVQSLALFPTLPAANHQVERVKDVTLGELYLIRQPRLTTSGFDLFVPVPALAAVADKLITAAKAAGGRPAGWTAFEAARIERGIPRFGSDMDEQNFPMEAGIADRAVSFNKGCYIGQEVLNRIHTMGHVNRELRRLEFVSDIPAPTRGELLSANDRELGHVTSAIRIPGTEKVVGLGYVRSAAAQPGTQLQLKAPAGTTAVKQAALEPLS
ncbi:MAG TPA: glycine cleavage T C-terminal barrel domain-containing protein [Verrucomicrobiae bacterium]|nr:glycine cleavage T C-terminal barrel domain-containing protein [Verrucomicrobiae bacterium]